MLRSRFSGPLVGLVLAAATALTGCAGGTPQASPTTVSTTVESAPTTTPSNDATGSKPSGSEVTQGWTAVLKERMPTLPDDAVKTAVSCLVGEIYDKVSVQTLRAIADRNVNNVDPDDVPLFTEAQTVCVNKIGKG